MTISKITVTFILAIGLASFAPRFVGGPSTSLRASPQAQPAPAAVAIDADDIGGVVSGPSGPEAGVWVIAETRDLPVRYIKIVATDDQGRYVIPDLPRARYSIWVRGYGLVDSAKSTSEPGKLVNFTATPAPTPADAAKYYPAIHWYSLLKIPDSGRDGGSREFCRQREPAAVDRIDEEPRLHRLPPARTALDAHDAGLARHLPLGHRRLAPPHPVGPGGRCTDYDHHQRPWYQDAVAQDRLIFTTPYVDARTQRLVMTIAAPVKNAQRLIGVIAADLFIDVLVQRVTALRLGEASRAYLVDRAGLYITHPQHEVMLTGTIHQSADAEVFRAFLAADRPSAIYAAAAHYTLVSRIPSTGWFLLFHLPYAEVQHPLQTLSLLFGVGVLLTLGVLGGWSS